MWSRPHVRHAVFAVVAASIGILLVTAAVQSRAQTATPSSGEALYQQRCASCHQGGVARAADTKALRQLSAERIGFALAYGIMSQQGRDLSRAPGTPGCTEAGRVLEISRSVLATIAFHQAIAAEVASRPCASAAGSQPSSADSVVRTSISVLS